MSPRLEALAIFTFELGKEALDIFGFWAGKEALDIFDFWVGTDGGEFGEEEGV